MGLMRRRDFIGAMGGAAVMWPLTGRAQPPALPVVGLLRTTPFLEHISAGLRAGLKESGFEDGRNVIIDTRYAENQPDRLPALAAELVQRQAKVIVADNIAAAAAKSVTATVPIVFVAAADPVASGLVPSLNRPGGNVTGISILGSALGAKRLELLVQLTPKATAIGMLISSFTSAAQAELVEVERAARAIGVPLAVFDIRADEDIALAFAAMAERKVSAVLIGAGATLVARRALISDFAARQRLPTLFLQREAVREGGLASYGASLSEAYREAGLYVARILRGEKAAELPVMQSVKFELVLNLKTARALGIEIPDRVLALADDVIE